MVLIGTEKQKAWASKIIRENQAAWKAEDPALLTEVRHVLNQQTSAAFWIANRDKSLAEVVEVIAKQQATKAAPSVPEVAGSVSPGATQSPFGEGWETIRTATGFMWSGPVRSITTGAIVFDDSLPF